MGSANRVESNRVLRLPEWKKMSAIPEYQDNLIVSHVTATMMNPTPYSQI
jgi:hypothetical protein